MSLDLIKQNVKSIIEVIDNYNSLLKRKKSVEEKSTKKELETKLAHLKGYFLKLVTNVQKLTKEEEKQLWEMDIKSYAKKILELIEEVETYKNYKKV